MAFEGTDDLTRLTTYNDTLRGGCPPVRADHAPVPGFRRHERLARPAAGAGRRPHRRRTCSNCRAGARLGRADRDQRRLAAGRARIRHPLPGPGRGGRPFRRLKAARIICSLREGAIRLSPHGIQHRRGDGAGRVRLGRPGEAAGRSAGLRRGRGGALHSLSSTWLLRGDRSNPSALWRPAACRLLGASRARSFQTRPMPSPFDEMLAAGYGFTDPAVTLGAALERNSTVHQEPKIKIPLAMMNRHGLIAGATGTGKTKTLQLLTEQLSAQGVPVFAADIKGDLAASPCPGEAGDRVDRPRQGHRLALEAGRRAGRVREPERQARASSSARRCSSFGPLLLGKVLVAQRHPDQRAHAGLQVLRRRPAPAARPAGSPGGAAVPRSDAGKPALGAVRRHVEAPRSGVLLRKMVELEQQGAGQFFGEPEFDVKDLMHVDLRRPRASSPARAGRRAGQAAAVLDLHDVDAGGAVPQPSRGRRPGQAQARVLLRRGAPAVRRTPARRFSSRSSRSCASSARRASGSTSSPRRPTDVPTTYSRSSATACSTRCGPTPPMTTRRSAPRSAPFPRPSSTIWRRRSPRSASARRS